MSLTRREVVLSSLFSAGALALPQFARAVDASKETIYDANPLEGKWTYRSFLSNPDVSVEFNKLEWGAGEMTIEPTDLGIFKAKLAFDKDVLELKGSVDYAGICTVRFQGTGVEGEAKSDHWVYDYLGFLAPNWHNGIDQRPAIVGTIVRTLTHSAGKAKAGAVNCWIAVKQDTK